jgi:catechol 2,3-dioxygenase-like lactoylglutathione lyase family enzyme
MPPMLGATGIGVSNMERSVAFYRDTLGIGLKQNQFFDVEHFTETIMGFPRGPKPTGSPIILMQYKDGTVPKNQQGKLVFYVEDVKAVMDRCKAYGCEVFLDLGAGQGWTKDIGLVRDPDGFLLEFLPLTTLKSSANWGDKAKGAKI